MGANLSFLPPDSLDFKPIEKTFAALPAPEQRIVSGLRDFTDLNVDLFKLDELENYFASCGYN